MAFWTNLFGKRRGPIDLDKPPTSSTHLRTQLFRTDYIGMRVLRDSGKAAIRHIAPGLVEAIVEDLGSGERTVSWDALSAFGSDHDQLFALARRQAAATETQVQSTTIADCVQVMASNSFYLSAYLLESFSKANRKHGILCVPVSWHHWCVHIVQPLSVPPIVAMLRLVADDVARAMTVTDAETLTNDVLWYKPGGVIEKLELTGTGPEVVATSPELAKAFESAFRDHARP